HSEVAAWRDEGVAVPEIERRLRERGLDSEEVCKLVDAALAEQVSSAARRQRRRDWFLLFGGVGLCLLGVLFFVGGIMVPHLGLFVGGVTTFGCGVTLIIRAVT